MIILPVLMFFLLLPDKKMEAQDQSKPIRLFQGPVFIQRALSIPYKYSLEKYTIIHFYQYIWRKYIHINTRVYIHKFIHYYI